MYQQHDQVSYKTNLQELNNGIARLGLKLSIEYDRNSFEGASKVNLSFTGGSKLRGRNMVLQECLGVK